MGESSLNFINLSTVPGALEEKMPVPGMGVGPLSAPFLGFNPEPEMTTKVTVISLSEVVEITISKLEIITKLLILEKIFQKFLMSKLESLPGVLNVVSMEFLEYTQMFQMLYVSLITQPNA